MLTTTNYGLKKPEGTDVVDIQNFNDNSDIIDQTLKAHDIQLSDMMVYQTAGGTATALTLIINGTLKNGYPVTFIASANNGGTATTINGRKLYKPATTNAPTLIKDKAYTVWYNTAGDNGNGCFFIKASAEGDAVAANVLAGKKFSNDNDTGLVGTLDLSNLVSGNIKSGVTVNGVQGNPNVVDTSNAVLDANYLVQGYSGYDDGMLKNGTLINRSAENWHQPASNVAISDANGYGAYVQPPRGYYDGNSWVRSLQPDLLAQNIVDGKTIFGVNGSAIAKQTQTDTGTIKANYTNSNSGITANISAFVNTIYDIVVFEGYSYVVYVKCLNKMFCNSNNYNYSLNLSSSNYDYTNFPIGNFGSRPSTSGTTPYNYTAYRL